MKQNNPSDKKKNELTKELIQVGQHKDITLSLPLLPRQGFLPWDLRSLQTP